MANDPLIPPSPSEAEHRAAEPDDDAGLFAHDDPIALFQDWFEGAKAREPRDPHAMSLATVDADGLPDVRTVLLKGVDGDGFVFYTNHDSAKGRQLEGNPMAALCFYWRSTVRQIRIRGLTQRVADTDADAYFASRARDSRIGAWASSQSRPLETRFALETRIASFAAKFGVGEIPRPPHWGGYRLVPASIEFWRERAFRLHDRRLFTRPAPGAPWRTQRLYP